MAKLHTGLGVIRQQTSTNRLATVPGFHIGRIRAASDPIYSTNLKIVSPLTSFAYNVYDNVGATSLQSGNYSTNPTYYDNHDAFSDSDTVTVFFLKYGYKFKVATFGLTNVETLLYLSHDANSNVTLSEAAAAALTGIAVDTGAQTVTISQARTQSEVYDFLQDYQSDPTNAASLLGTEIFSTVLGNTFNLLPDWTFVFDAIPSGAWNIDGGTVVFNFAGGAVSDFDYGSTLYFDSGADSSIFAFTDSSIVSIDTVVGYGGVGGIGFTPAGTTQVPTNLDLTNITINAPQPTVTITGHPVGATVVIHDEDSADLQNKGTSLQRFDNAAASVHYTGTVGNLVSISMYEPGYKIFERQYTIPSNDATFIIEPELETN
jgi:hypothetical protein